MTRRWLLRGLLSVALVLAAGAGVSALGVLRIESAAPPAGRFITVGGYRLHYTDQGEGTPVLLVHGANSNLLEFQTSLVPRLARHHRVLVFDRPGFGYSGRGDGPWPHPGVLARLLLDASEALGAPRPVIVGHSWAGSVVMSALLRERHRIGGGVLLAGVAGHWTGEEDLVERLRDWPALNAVAARVLVVPAGSLLLPRALEAVFAPHPVPPGHAERVGAALALRPSTYLANAEDMNRLSGFLQRESTCYPTIEGPLLVIHGTQDTLVPYWNHGRRLLPVIDGVETVLMEGQGHALHHVEPARVAQHIHEFTRRVAAGGTSAAGAVASARGGEAVEPPCSAG